MIKGRCDCAKVSFQVESVRKTVTACHCYQCRRTSGHFWASTKAAFDAITFSEREGLEWYHSSAIAKRGFCKFCGSSLFYRMNDEQGVPEEGIGIAAGCLEGIADLHIDKHIYVKDKGCYYSIDDEALKLDQY